MCAYLAHGCLVGFQVAIKRLLGNWYRDTGMVSRFREEIVLMSSLDHPNGTTAASPTPEPL